MVDWRVWRSPGHRLLWMFLTAAVLLGGTLLLLGWQLLRQDRELTAQRLQGQREVAADLASAALQKSLARTDGDLTALSTLPMAELAHNAAALAAALPDDSALIVDTEREVQAYPPKRLPFLPVTAPDLGLPADLFAAAEVLEFQQKDSAKALTLLQPMARSNDASVRAAALLRIGRIQRKDKHRGEALRTYEAMLGLAGVSVEGVPAELVARQQRIGILSEEAQPAAERVEAIELLKALTECRYIVSSGVFEFLSQEALTAVGNSKSGAEPSAMALATAAESVHAKRLGEEEQAGRLLLREGGEPILVIWRVVNDQVIALLLGPHWLEAQWAAHLKATLATYGVAIRLSDLEGQAVFGPTKGQPGQEAVRLASNTDLPWNLHAVTVDPGAALAPVERRRRLVFAGMVALVVLILTGAFLIGRTATRELELSRLESDFVSSVSHEFRTPLTSLCLLSEHLASGRISRETDRQEYFAVLAQESQRLRRLVEGLLNFGRMEAGAVEYRFETIDPTELVRAVSCEFEGDSEARGHHIEVRLKEDTPLVRADRAALACAVWNLIDNAVKYSPECKTVWADVERAGEFAAIRVRDRGMGIPAQEQVQIFRKFVRGDAARRSSIQGTGVGLAMVQHIVTAHRGALKVESKAGEGSVFTVLLPAVS